MLHFVIAAAIIVGVWYQWILPERRRKAERALVWRHYNPEDRDHTPEGQRELDRLWRRAGYPVQPKPAASAPVRPLRPNQPPRWRGAPTAPLSADDALLLRWVGFVGVVCVLVLVLAG